MDNQNKMNCIMTLSGFGPFGSVTENPTMRLIKSITEDERKVFNILVCEVVETSTIGVKAHLEELTKLK
jgi:pyrrolidone-carboxylate peptidase